MNEIYFIKISGKVNIPERLPIGHNYKLMADCSVVSEQKTDLENGDFDITSKLVPIHVEVLKDNGVTIKAKDPRSNSVKFRNYCFKVWKDSPAEIYPFDDFYTAMVQEAMSILPSLLDSAIKRLEE